MKITKRHGTISYTKLKLISELMSLNIVKAAETFNFIFAKTRNHCPSTHNQT